MSKRNFNELLKNDLNHQFDYNKLNGRKIISEIVSLDVAKYRKQMHEYFVLVTYTNEEELPEEYMPFKSLSNDTINYATLRQDYSYEYLCRSSLFKNENKRIVYKGISPDFSPMYLVSPSYNEVVTIRQLIYELCERYSLDQHRKGK